MSKLFVMIRSVPIFNNSNLRPNMHIISQLVIVNLRKLILFREQIKVQNLFVISHDLEFDWREPVIFTHFILPWQFVIFFEVSRKGNRSENVIFFCEHLLEVEREMAGA